MTRHTWPDPAWQKQLAAFEAWLDNHPDHPALLASCRRIAKVMTGTGGAR